MYTFSAVSFLGWSLKSDGSYLESLKMGTESITLYAIFRENDITPPVIENTSYTSTTNSITVAVTARDTETNVTKYEYSINDGEYVTGSNNYTFTGLTQNMDYKVKVRVTNEDGLSSIKELELIKTKVLEKPIYSQNGNVVTITYPSGCENVTCSYIKDDGEEVVVKTNTVDVEFTKNGTLTAKVNDKTNYETSSYTAIVALDPIKTTTSPTRTSINATRTSTSATRSSTSASYNCSSYTTCSYTTSATATVSSYKLACVPYSSSSTSVIEVPGSYSTLAECQADGLDRCEDGEYNTYRCTPNGTSYSCSSGTLSGSTCYHYYSCCDSGYYYCSNSSYPNLSGSTCYSNYACSNSNYPNLSGTTCYSNYSCSNSSYPNLSGSLCYSNYTCPSGYKSNGSGSSMECYKYTCNSGYTLNTSDNKCYLN